MKTSLLLFGLILLASFSLNAGESAGQIEFKCSGFLSSLPPSTGVSVSGILKIASSSQNQSLMFDLYLRELTGRVSRLQRVYTSINSASSTLGSINFLCGIMPNSICAQLSYLKNMSFRDLISKAQAGTNISILLNFDPSEVTHNYLYSFQLNCQI